MEKFISFFENLYNGFLAFYSNLNSFGIYMFYGTIVCIILILFVLVFIKTKRVEKLEPEYIGPAEEPINKIESLEEVDEPVSDIYKMRDRLEADLEVEKSSNFIDSFEAEQEATAVISYEELKRAQARLEETEKIPVIPYPEVRDLPEEAKTYEKKEDLTATGKYRRSEFISPVYGVQKKYDPKHTEKDMDLEKTINLEPLNREIKNSMEFLESLKDLRKNLN